MFKFIFKGVVTKFGKAVTQRITLETMAPTKDKAKSNFIAQAKKQLQLNYGASGIDIQGEIIMC